MGRLKHLAQRRRQVLLVLPHADLLYAEPTAAAGADRVLDMVLNAVPDLKIKIILTMTNSTSAKMGESCANTCSRCVPEECKPWHVLCMESCLWHASNSSTEGKINNTQITCGGNKGPSRCVMTALFFACRG